MNRPLLRALIWAILLELALLAVFLFAARDAGPHNLALWLTLAPQYPGIAIMSWLLPNEAAGGPGAMAAYYSGLVAIQASLWAIVLFLWFRSGAAGGPD